MLSRSHTTHINPLLSVLFVLAWSIATACECKEPPRDSKVLFLGDSITYAGEYVNMIEAAWRIQYPNDSVDIVNLGLPSETVSGLSEEGHAGGAFPRPNLHERLSRVLDQVAPDVVVACYGMNDGIYHPLREDRFAAFQRGVKKLIRETKQRKIKLFVLTPAFVDALPIQDRLLPDGLNRYPQPYAKYDDVLETYATWLLTLASDELIVVDIHKAMKEAVLGRRQTQPNFTFASDGVHPNSLGHRVIAEAVGNAWGLDISPVDENKAAAMASLLPLVAKRQSILKHAWLTSTKHNRPGIEPGLDRELASAEASEIERSISEIVSKH